MARLYIGYSTIYLGSLPIVKREQINYKDFSKLYNIKLHTKVIRMADILNVSKIILRSE